MRVEVKDGVFLINGQTKILVCYNNGEVFKIAKDLTQRINNAKSYNIKTVKGDDALEMNNEIRFSFSEDGK